MAYTLGDFESVLDGVHLDIAPVSLDAGAAFLPAVALLAVALLAVALLILAPAAMPLALAQTNIDQGKPASELFANYCAVCHKSTRGLANGRSGPAATFFIRPRC